MPKARSLRRRGGGLLLAGLSALVMPLATVADEGEASALADSASAYLRQHADNPIDWQTWQPSVLDRAIDDNRLIFLSIGYASCHWCHVMEKESFSDADVGAVLDADFISIKVDREQQPDVDRWYSRVVQTLNGETGWPITVIMLPDRRPVLAANYLGRDELLTALDRLAAQWREAPEQLDSRAGLLATLLEPASLPEPPAAAPDWPELMSQAESQMRARADTVFGGFGQAEKFPDETELAFLLDRYKLDPSPELEGLLTRQLDALMYGGLADPVFGGVFRYTTDREMTRPHFEKMLYNQALTAMLFIDAADLLGQARYRDFADDIVDFVNGALAMEDGRFAAAVDADHDGVEGGYYRWPASEGALLPTGVSAVEAGPGQVYLLGTSADPDWTGRLANRRDAPPRVIDHPVTAWNGLWLLALLATDATDQARALGDVLWETSVSDGEVERMPGQPGFLDDYAVLSVAYWRLYLATLEPRWKSRAQVLDEVLLEQFIRDGEVRYAREDDSLPYPDSLAADTEQPAPLAFLAESFGYHFRDVRFANAQTRLLATANIRQGQAASFASMLRGQLEVPGKRAFMASGHGRVGLRPGEGDNRWWLDLDLEPGWHVNAATVNEPHLIPTTLTSQQGPLAPEWPAGEELLTSFSEVPLNVWSGAVRLPVRADVGRALQVVLRVQACNDRVCLPPERLVLRAARR
ncbi:thioredoxin domain-containing protein [Marinihelvus fidelis]|nr:DUF255 domain-containing protein [Marinihelvus fidelis]